jgi:hypothetical protein
VAEVVPGENLICSEVATEGNSDGVVGVGCVTSVGGVSVAIVGETAVGSAVVGIGMGIVVVGGTAVTPGVVGAGVRASRCTTPRVHAVNEKSAREHGIIRYI